MNQHTKCSDSYNEEELLLNCKGVSGMYLCDSTILSG